MRPALHPATQAAPPPRQHRDVLQALNRSRQPAEGAEGATRHAARPGETRAGRRFLCAHATAPLGWDAGSLRDRPAAFPVTLPVGALHESERPRSDAAVSSRWTRPWAARTERNASGWRGTGEPQRGIETKEQTDGS